MDFLDDLNEPQRDAVLHQQGPLLVLAGAGSGKTRVITRRIASLVRDRKVPAWRILAVTFTNKAAREMRERLEHLLGPLAQGLTVSTFHSASALILRREAENVGLERNFVIYDDGDQLQVVRRAIREAGIDVASVTPREILSKIDAEKNQGPLHRLLLGVVAGLHLVGQPALVLLGVDLRENVARRDRRDVDAALANRATHHLQLISVVVDHEVALEADVLCFASEDQRRG